MYIEAGNNCAACQFVRGRVIDIEDNGCITPKSAWTFLCATGTNSCLNENFATAGSDGCGRVFMSATCNGQGSIGIYCIASDGSSVCAVCRVTTTCTNMGRLIYSGNPGVMVIGPTDNGGVCQSLIRFESGVAGCCVWNISPNSETDRYARAWTPLVLNTESMSITGWALSSDCYLYSSDYVVWNSNACCWCVNNSTCCQNYISCPTNNMGFCQHICNITPSAVQRGRTVKIGPSFSTVGSDVSYYVPALTYAGNYYRLTCSQNCTNISHRETYIKFKPPMSYNIYFERTTGVIDSNLPQQGCSSHSELNQYYANLVYNERAPSDYDVSFPCCSIVTQQNGTKSMGKFGKAGNFYCSAGSAHAEFTTWETSQNADVSEYMSGYGTAPVWSYGHTLTDNIYTGECRYLGTGVVGKKWLVGMEFAGCCACECIGFKVYEMISCNTSS